MYLKFIQDESLEEELRLMADGMNKDKEKVLFNESIRLPSVREEGKERNNENNIVIERNQSFEDFLKEMEFNKN